MLVWRVAGVYLSDPCSGLAQAPVHGVQPEGAGGEDPGGEVPADPVPLFRGAELPGVQNAALKGTGPKNNTHQTPFIPFTGSQEYWNSLRQNMKEF